MKPNARQFMATYRSVPTEPKNEQVSTDEALLAPQSASGKPQDGDASPAVTKRPLTAGKRPAPILRFRRSCVLCGVDTKDLEEHECSLDDLMQNAARNADDQLGVYG